ARDAELRERIGRTERVGKRVEGAVERHVEPTGLRDEPVDGLPVDAAHLVECADDHTGRTGLAGESDVPGDRVQLVGVVDETAAARPDQDVYEARAGLLRGLLDRGA